MKENKQPTKLAYSSPKIRVLPLSTDVITESVGTFSLKDDAPFRNSWLKS